MSSQITAADLRTPASDAGDGASDEGLPAFDVDVPQSGYRWWYADGISDDGREGIVIIAFVGSVFSPYYFRARARGPADPLDFCAVNVGLYRRSGKLWAMTERGRDSVERERRWYRVGQSSLEWRADALHIDIDERSMPLGRTIRGRVSVHPRFIHPEGFALDPAAQHRWRPVAPVGRIEVEMARPAVRWRGAAYFDTNSGRRALEDDFEGWHWSRHGDDDGARITYAATLLDGSASSLAMVFDAGGGLRRTELPPEVELASTAWRVPRSARSAVVPTVRRTLEDTPFYARSILQVDEGRSRQLVMHESLSLARFRTAWVRLLLPFRMPRVAGRA